MPQRSNRTHLPRWARPADVGCLDRAQASIDLDALSYLHLLVRGVSFCFSRAAELGAVIAGLDTDVLPAVADGRIRPVIDSILGLEQAAGAADRIRTGQAHGKVVMSMP